MAKKQTPHHDTSTVQMTHRRPVRTEQSACSTNEFGNIFFTVMLYFFHMYTRFCLLLIIAMFCQLATNTQYLHDNMRVLLVTSSIVNFCDAEKHVIFVEFGHLFTPIHYRRSFQRVLECTYILECEVQRVNIFELRTKYPMTYRCLH